jgi:Vacuolar protein sorting-associated protein
MVFESVVAEILNRFLGDYVENLDHSQLKIGIWGGKSNIRVVFFGVDVCNCGV